MDAVMKQLLSVVLAVSFAGCAMTPEKLAEMSEWDVCKATMGGPSAVTAQQEMQRRGLDCKPLYGAIVSQQASFLQLYNATMATSSPPAFVTPMPPVNCRSVRVSPTIVRTECN